MEGMSITKEDAEITAAFNDAWQDLTTSLQRVAAIVFRAITPALTKIAKVLRTFTDFIRKNERYVLMFFTALATVLAARLIPKFKEWALTMLANPLFQLVAVIAVLVAIIEDLYVGLTGGESAIFKFFGQFEWGRKVLGWLQTAFDWWKDNLPAILDEAGIVVGWLAEKFEQAFDIIGSVINTVIDVIQTLIGWIQDAIDWLSDSKLVKGINTVVEGFKGIGNWLFGGDESGGNAGMNINPSDALNGAALAGSNSYNIENSQDIGTIVINTQATDANGIAKDIGPALNNQRPGRLVNQTGTPLAAY